MKTAVLLAGLIRDREALVAALEVGEPWSDAKEIRFQSLCRDITLLGKKIAHVDALIDWSETQRVAA
jgi:hypothetical protein